MARIESSLRTWQQIQQVVERGIQQSNSDAAARRLVRLGQRISRINACLRLLLRPLPRASPPGHLIFTAVNKDNGNSQLGITCSRRCLSCCAKHRPIGW